MPMQQRQSFTAWQPTHLGNQGVSMKMDIERDQVPMSFRVSKSGNLIVVPFKRAQFVLIDMLEGSYVDGEYLYDYYGSVVSTMFLSNRKRVYIYYKVDQLLMPRSRNILAMLSRHFMNSFDGYYNDICHIDNVFLGCGKARKVMRHTIEGLGSLPIAKISAAHHIHFTAEEVWQILDGEERIKAKEALRLPPDTTTTMMGGVMLWLASLEEDLYQRFIATDILDADSMVGFAKLAKPLSVSAKSYQNLVEQDLRKIFEIDVLVNRDVGSVDWIGEKVNRVTPNLVKISKKEVYDLAVKMFSRDDETRENPRKLEWKDFWESRWQWSASGSVHSQYTEDVKDLPKQRELRNKFVLLNQLPYLKFDHFAARRSEIQAWSSIKYEWAKMRAIYGTDLTSYIMSHYAFYNCEDVLPNEFPVGNKARPSYVSAKVESVLFKKTPLCIDFEDFNSGHSNDSMQAVIDAYLYVFGDALTPEQRAAVVWTRNSVANTTVHDNMGTKTTYKTKGTLMSGWRLTTFMNSVLNYIYTQMLMRGSKVNVNSVHNGDDVLLGVNNFDVARRAVFNADKYNIRLQRSKCAFGGIAEFLRVDRVRGDYGQYLTRNIATLMHSRIESKVALSAVDLVEADEERLREFVQRGGSERVAAMLRNKAYSRTAKLYDTNTLTLYDIKHYHRVVGGVSDDQFAPIDKMIIKENVPQVSELPSSLPGVMDYSKQIKQTLDLEVPLREVYKRIYKATLNAVQLVRTSVKSVDNTNKHKFVMFRALYKAHADVTSSPLYGKAMLTGFVFDVLNKGDSNRALVNLLHQSRDPMFLLKMVT
nr:RNA-dependent RNA polymerase [Umbelopsis ramanniana virus 8b]